MQNTFLLLLCALLCLIGCKKDEDIDMGFPGIGSALINGTEWNGRAGVFRQNSSPCDLDTCISIIIGHIVDSTQFTTKMSFNYVSLKKQKVLLNRLPSDPFIYVPNYFLYNESIIDGDIILLIATYQVAEGDTNSYLEITDFDVKTGAIEGRFEVTAIESLSPSQQGEIPDTIRITDGWFSSTIEWN